MRVMVLVKSNEWSESGAMPDEKLLTAMGAYNEELAKAGLLRGGEGLHPSKAGKRVHFAGDKRTVIDGPFTEAKELIAGYWIWEVDSMEHAVEWAKKCPNPMPGESDLEIRRIFELDDFGAELTPELRAQEERLFKQSAGRK